MKWNLSTNVISESQGVVFLKLANSDNIVKMSKIEYDILKYYVEENDKEKVINHFRNEILIDFSQLDILIQKASELGVLNDDISLNKIRWLHLKFKKKGKLLEIITINLTGSILESFFEKRKFINTIFVCLAILSVIFIVDILKEPLMFKESYMQTLYAVPVSFTSIIWFIYIASILSSVFHETGHYLMYKKFGGKSSIFGFGLMIFILPVFYNKIYVSFLSKRNNRQWVYSAGIIFDIVMFLFLLFFTKKFHVIYPILSFLAYTLMISITIRTFFNLNFFLPGTDAYHIISEWLKIKNLFNKAISETKLVISNKKINIKKTPYILYTFLSLLSIIISWLFMFFPIIMLLLYYASIRK